MKKIDFYLKEGQLAKDPSVVALMQKYLDKAQNNLITMRILSEIQINNKARELLKIPRSYDANEWVVICGYYAMYSAALALLSKIGFRSKNHAATLLVLEEYYVAKRYLKKEDVLSLSRAQFQKDEIEKISDARHKREIAQYSITKRTTKEIAESIRKDTYEFLDKVESVLRPI